VNSETKKLTHSPGKEKKPMAMVRKVNLFHREIMEKLSTSALEILLGRAEVLSEGNLCSKQFKGAGVKYFGSSMLTMNLNGAGDHIRDPLDASSAVKLRKLLLTDKKFNDYLRKIARKEAEKIAGVSLMCLEMEISVSAEGAEILVDLDVEAAVYEGEKPRQMVLKRGRTFGSE